MVESDVDSTSRYASTFRPLVAHRILRHLEQAYNLDLFWGTKPNEFELFASVFVFFFFEFREFFLKF